MDALIVTSPHKFSELVIQLKDFAGKRVIVAVNTRTAEADDIGELDAFEQLRKLANQKNLELTFVASDKFIIDLARFWQFDVHIEVWDGQENNLNEIVAKIEAAHQARLDNHQAALTIAQDLSLSPPENKSVRIKVTIPLKIGGIPDVEMGEYLELSLDCSTCLKTQRTTFIYEDAEKSFCTPKYYTRHPIRARIIDKEITNEAGITSLIYIAEYPYFPFIDKRHIDRNPIPEFAKSKELASWVRVHFKLRCPKCNHSWDEESTQSNVTMTLDQKCACGYLKWEAGQQPTYFEKIS